MTKPAMQTLGSSRQAILVPSVARQVSLVVGGSLLVALCARVSIPLPFTPVLLGSRRGFAALAVYLFEGAMGLPVFSPTGPGGIAQLLGPTGGFLLTYPFVAALAGYFMEHGRKTFARAALAGLLGEVVLFIGGLSWLAVLTHSVAQAFRWGLYWFLFAEVIKVMMAAGIAARWQQSAAPQS